MYINLLFYQNKNTIAEMEDTELHLSEIISCARTHIINGGWPKETLEYFEASVKKLLDARNSKKEGEEDIVYVRIMKSGSMIFSGGRFEHTNEDEPGFIIREDLATWDPKAKVSLAFSYLVYAYNRRFGGGDGGGGFYRASNGYRYGTSNLIKSTFAVANIINRSVAKCEE